ALIGAGAALAWSHRDDANELVRAWIPSTGRSLSVTTAKQPTDATASRPQLPATQDAASPQSTPPVAQNPVSSAPPAAPEPERQDDGISERDLAALQPSDEQASPKQEQTAQSIAPPPEPKDEKPSSASQAQPAPTSAPEVKQTPIAGWILHEVTN